jgi:HD-GYP domain-containing protein (c-di-GMP phosphodiesterase class II)
MQSLTRPKNQCFCHRESKAFFDYLENNFQLILTDTSIPPDEKSKIVHGAATNLVKDLFNDPRAGNIERTKTFAYNMVDYILHEGIAARSLLKIAIHEYYTYTHSVNVAAVGTLFAKELSFEDKDLKHFCSGILLHDVGKTRNST